MELRALIDELTSLLGERARPGEPLARHTSLRIGGPADVLVVPDDAHEMAAVVRAARAHGVPLAVLGNGSNLLVGDGGMRGVVVKLGPGFRRVEWPAGSNGRAIVRAGAATQLGKLAREAAARGLAGLEHAEGIPATVGGALFMNAGAYGGDMAGAVAAVEGVDAEGHVLEIGAPAVGFAYRRTALPPGFIVTAVRLELRSDDSAAVRERLDGVRARRVASQPHGDKSAGSMFKNPPGDFAGRLIDATGLRGRRVGGARISEQHANFIVNENRARAVDVQALMAMAQRAVWERSGVWLEPEVRLVGSW
jgi:UDP-N-acetylmuramate dehydrogenase